MDGERFDALAIALTRRGVVRAGLGALLAGAAGALLGRADDAAGQATCKAPGQICRRGSDCCATNCRKRNGKKRGRCRFCEDGALFCGTVCCVPGEDCVGGSCTCSGASCPIGCCDGRTCQDGTTSNRCGRGGAACDTCADDQECVDGTCTCTAASCAAGCCAQGVCRVDDANACGTGGGPCTDCDPGQRCVSGDCVCDATSCQGGCCNGRTCVPIGEQSNGRCGTGTSGAACVECPAIQECGAGVCRNRACGDGGPCLVFLSSSQHNGNLGGLAGADATCRNLAAAAGLPRANFFLAWLSDGSTSPATRFPTRSTGPYRLVNGTTIANDWSDLTDGTLAAPINVTEAGVAVGTAAVWTHTRTDGTAGGDANVNCSNWTSTSGGGDIGIYNPTTAEWTAAASGGVGIGCTAGNGNLRLYCFQQG